MFTIVCSSYGWVNDANKCANGTPKYHVTSGSDDVDVDDTGLLDVECVGWVGTPGDCERNKLALAKPAETPAETVTNNKLRTNKKQKGRGKNKKRKGPGKKKRSKE